MNKSLKTLALVALCAVSGLLRAAVEVEKVVEIETPSSDTGFYYQTHLPYLGWPVGIPISPVAIASSTYLLAKWTVVASGVYGLAQPKSVVALPAQFFLAIVLGIGKGIKNVHKMRTQTDMNPSGYDNNAFALAAGSLGVAAFISHDYWLPHVANYAYNKIPSTADVMNPIYAKIYGKKKVETDIVEIAQ